MSLYVRRDRKGSRQMLMQEGMGEEEEDTLMPCLDYPLVF